MREWGGFYSGIAGVAATLLGLLFVAVSINAAEVLNTREGHSRRLAEQAFRNYFNVVLLALITLIPDITPPSLGLATIGLTALASVFSIVRVGQSLTAGFDRSSQLQAMRRHATSIVGFGLLIFAAFRMTEGDDSHRDIFASGLIVLLASATVVSWELLLKIATARQAGSAPGTRLQAD